MQLIQNWRNKNLTCCNCGETRSVKYEHENKHYCNKCIVLTFKHDKSTINK